MKNGMTGKGRKFHLGVPNILTDGKKLMVLDELVPEWKRPVSRKKPFSQVCVI